ncbi:MAG: AMP-dependent synthetase [Candidatus Thorarchaeota archaeon]|nr:MAG: AMP-dependent synthetase [Candidatus Thorarchaeota archaeon]
MNVVDNLFQESKSAKRIALFQGKETITYPDLYRDIQRVSAKLSQMGHKAGDKILIMADNSFFWVAAYFGTMGAGMVALPLHHTVSESHLDFVRESCEVRTCFVQRRYVKNIAKYNFPNVIADEAGVPGTTYFGDIPAAKFRFVDVDIQNALAVIIFTSGSTGKPKGVMLSHRNIEWNTDSIIEYLSLTENDRMMVVLPFSYCYGASWLHTLVKVGGQIALNNRFMFPGLVLNEMVEKKCTGFAGVPSTYQILLRRSAMKKMKFPDLRFAAQAGGKLSNPFILELIEALPTTKIFIMYGQTEATARLSYLPPELLKAKLGSCGKGIPRTTLEVLKDSGEPVKLGEVGEIVASGGNIMMGYWKDPEGTAKALRNGKLYTGDLATVDEEGFIFVVDRQKEIIKSGGYRVSPREVEETIASIEDVVEVGVIGVPDDLMGEAVKAYVVLREGSGQTERDIINHCRGRLPSFKVPKYVKLLKSLPKNEAEKVMMAALRDMHSKGE